MNDCNASSSPRRLRPSLRRVIVRSFRDAWDHLGLVAAASFFIALLPAALASLSPLLANAQLWVTAAVLLAIALIKGPVLAGVFRLMYKAAYGEDPEIADLLAGFKEILGASVSLIVLDTFVIVVLAADAAFFLGIIGPVKTSPIGIVIGCVFVFLLIIWLCSTAYQFPALSTQKPLGQRVGALAAARKALLAALGAPFYTIGMFLTAVVFALVCFLSAFGIFLLMGGVVSLIYTHALKELYICCGVVDESPDAE